jgi:hypothetical protein
VKGLLVEQQATMLIHHHLTVMSKFQVFGGLSAAWMTYHSS